MSYSLGFVVTNFKVVLLTYIKWYLKWVAVIGRQTSRRYSLMGSRLVITRWAAFYLLRLARL